MLILDKRVFKVMNYFQKPEEGYDYYVQIKLSNLDLTRFLDDPYTFIPPMWPSEWHTVSHSTIRFGMDVVHFNDVNSAIMYAEHLIDEPFFSYGNVTDSRVKKFGDKERIIKAFSTKATDWAKEGF